MAGVDLSGRVALDGQQIAIGERASAGSLTYQKAFRVEEILVKEEKPPNSRKT